MNLIHRYLCSSSRWKRVLSSYILPWALQEVQLNGSVLEIGPGPGITTDLLRDKVGRLTCVEVDKTMAESLRDRQAGTNVTVLCEDAADMSLPDASFDAAVCFNMLHHVPSAAMQDRLLTGVARVLRRGGTFAGTDSIYSLPLRLIHLLDTMVLIDPGTFPSRLRKAGFDDIRLDVKPPYGFRFRAIKA